MKTKNSVFIATSLDGFIADKDEGIDWLEMIPNPRQDDMGAIAFFNQVDAMIMGRNTFETVLGFGVDWPYPFPVFVLSNSMKKPPKGYENKIQILNGPLKEVVANIHSQGHHSLYIDGGTVIQNFLKEDLIDELIVTRIPILLGGGISLFGDMPKSLEFEHVKTEVYLDQIVQSQYSRKK
ncbi:dihydrofolate reductase family protein [Urechidicola vernalis]|uniref:Dihydrofolate reductase family protein n=1 Tax=Urechidicola vernalis TaxID=3075600 RepID=A0ABU2Y6M4_9FLAO|nr:dihydrofolate reductase family protein [Urechidicola sp. P050]MDT0553692.1 dihydrofolate reductase family protein [Urechidicola sp. P050]